MNQEFMKEKPVLPLLLQMGIPMILSMIVGALYNIIDSIFVAMISEDAMTALSIVYPLQNLAHAAGVGFGIGINAFVARALGEKNTKAADLAASQGMFLALIHGLVITGVGLLFIRPFIGMYTKNTAVIRYGLAYFNVVFLFSVMDNLGMAVEKIYQSLGRMMTAMTAVLIGCVLNIILDPLLIFGVGPFPKLGIEGAALATGLGQTATFIFYVLLYRKKPLPVRIARDLMRPTRPVAGRLYSVGIAAALNMAVTSVLLSVLNAILAPFGELYVLILGVYYKFQNLLSQAACGLVQGMRPLVSYNFGAGEHRRVSSICKTSIGIIAVIMIAGTLACQTAPAFLIGLFTKNTATVTEGVTALRIISLGFAVSSVSIVLAGALEGLGLGSTSLAVCLLRYVVIILPTAFLLSRLIGPLGVWNAFWISEMAAAVCSIFIYRAAVKKLLSLPSPEENA